VARAYTLPVGSGNEQCPACGAANPAGASFCVDCGAALARPCPSCGAGLPGKVRFCPSCGTAVGEDAVVHEKPAAGREGRKVVTALFADVVGSTQLGERFDPEDFRELVGEAVARMVGVVEELGGTVKDLAGDGVLALFGAPASHEDDPERAALAGLRIVERMRE
jgi:double zinc ribbon protein